MHFQLEGDLRTEGEREGGSLTYAVTSERLPPCSSLPCLSVSLRAQRRLVTLTSCQGRWRWQCGWWVTYLATGLEREGRMEGLAD